MGVAASDGGFVRRGGGERQHIDMKSSIWMGRTWARRPHRPHTPSHSHPRYRPCPRPCRSRDGIVERFRNGANRPVARQRQSAPRQDLIGDHHKPLRRSCRGRCLCSCSPRFDLFETVILGSELRKVYPSILPAQCRLFPRSPDGRDELATAATRDVASRGKRSWSSVRDRDLSRRNSPTVETAVSPGCENGLVRATRLKGSKSRVRRARL